MWRRGGIQRGERFSLVHRLGEPMNLVLGRTDARLAVLLVGVFLWGGLGSGAVRADEVPYRHFSTFDGLPGNHVTVLTQTANGLLWVGTGSGLAVYDGHEYRQISFPDSLGTAYIYSIAEGSDGSVWVSPSMGVVAKVGKNGLERVFGLKNGAYIREILFRNGEVVFLGTSNYWTMGAGTDAPVRHSYRYEIRSVSEVKKSPNAGVGVFDAALAPDGQIWVLDGRLGPGRLQADGSVSFSGATQGTYGDFWYEIGFAEEGGGVLTKGRRLFHFDPSTGEFREVSDRLGDPTYLSVDGNVAYATRDHTVLRYDVSGGQMQAPLGLDLGLPETMVRRVRSSREGALWIGTRDGLIQVMNPNVRVLGSVAGTSVYNVHSFAAAEEALWARTHGAGLIQLRPEREVSRPGGFVDWKYDVQGRDGFLHALSSPSRMWMRWRPDTGWKRVREVASAIGGVVLADGHGHFRHPDGLYRYPSAPGETPDTLLSWSAENDYTRLAPARGNALLLQKNEHLLRVDPSARIEVDTLGQPPNLREGGGASRGGVARSLAMDDEGRVWATSPSGGLVQFNPASGNRRTVLDSVLIGNVRALGDSLVLAMSAEKGVYFVESATGRVQEHLTQADGLRSAGALDAHIVGDTLYVAHLRGMSLFPTEDLYREQSSPSVLLTGVEAGLEDRPLTSGATFDAKERTVEFSYTAPSLSYADRIAYGVRLVSQGSVAQGSSSGFGEWEKTNRRFMRYTNLEPGTYRFEVRARLGDRPPGTAAAYTFTIPPHFYETWWFRLLVGLGVVALGVGAWRRRTARLRRRQEALEAAVDAQTEELRQRTEELAAEKQRTQAQAERLAELDEAKNRFFAHISHEFRTPLSLILTPLEEALRDATTGTVAFGTEQVERMVHNARRLQRLIEQLLDLATLEAGRMELDRQMGDLGRVVRRSAKAFVSMAKRKEIDLRVRTSGDTLQARFDPEKVESIVNNLLSNALKFTPAGGRVTVWIGERTTPGRLGNGAAREALIKVADTGPGMDDETQSGLFERFEHVDTADTREHEGAGLGLALTKELVELHGGAIEVESSRGEGTVFTVALPMAGDEEDRSPSDTQPEKPEAGPSVPAELSAVSGAGEDSGDGQTAAGDGAPPGEAADGRRETVLVVEDNAEMRAYLREQLSPHWNVHTAADGAAGWAAVQEREPDLVLSDVMMPSVSGFELCEELKSDPDHRHIPVILLTARAETDDALEGLDCGADDYVSKPFDVQELRQRIANHLAAREHLREQYREEVHLASMDEVVDEEDISFLETVTETVEAHLGNPDLTVDRLAEAAALSRRQLTRRMKEAVGQTPAAFVRARRIERAKELLARDTETVAEVAYAVGFRSSSAFSKAFRKHVGHPPSEHADKGTE